jgi:hypothetical protein
MATKKRGSRQTSGEDKKRGVQPDLAKIKQAGQLLTVELEKSIDSLEEALGDPGNSEDRKTIIDLKLGIVKDLRNQLEACIAAFDFAGHSGKGDDPDKGGGKPRPGGRPVCGSVFVA